MGVSKELLMRRRNLGSPHIATATGAVASFAGNMAAPLKECKCEFTPVQSGSGDPSPINERPISGWTGCNVVRCGKNLLNPATTLFKKWRLDSNKLYTMPDSSTLITYTVNTDNSITVTTTGTFCGIGIEISAVPYARTASIGSGVVDAFQTWQSYADEATRIATGGTTREIPANTSLFLAVRSDTAQTFTFELQLELGTTATSYEPYTGNTYAVDWTDEAGTVYGGNVDPVRGVMRAEFYSVTKTWGDFGNKTSLGSNTRGTLSLASNPSTSLGPDAKCNVAPRATGYSVDACHFYTNLDDCIMVLPNDTADSTEIQVVYPLATPITYQLTPQIIKSLKTGTNNVFSSLNGNTMVKYWKH